MQPTPALKFLKKISMLTLADPKICQIPLIDNGERLIPLDGLNARIIVDSSKENADALAYELSFFIRETVGRKLVEAVLKIPDNYAFLVKESLRPQNLQALWFSEYLRSILEANPELPEGDAVALAARFVAPPSVAGHPTGGAVDLTLCDLRGYELDLGCAYDQDEKASNGACLSHFEQLSPEASKHRRILFKALSSVGFVNYPFEWWHWSYGDRYWAAVTEHPHALYGAVADCQQSRFARSSDNNRP